jgi:CheY-like chemotaxis protein
MRQPSSPRILVVEDEALIAMEIEAQLLRLRYVVLGPLAALDEALEAARSLSMDGALLDVNIKGGKIFPVADVLLARGIPVILSTGVGFEHLPPHLRVVTCLRKPFSARQLEAAVTEVFADSETSDLTYPVQGTIMEQRRYRPAPAQAREH